MKKEGERGKIYVIITKEIEERPSCDREKIERERDWKKLVIAI